MNLDGVRTFVAVVDTGQFQEAAAELGITQQAVSKRIAALESDLGVRLFLRGRRGALLTIDGHAFVRHARALLDAEARAEAAMRPGTRPLRVDVLARRSGPAFLMRAFRRAHPDLEVEVLTIVDFATVADALVAGEIDATFRAVLQPLRRLGSGLTSARALDEPLELITGPTHPLASRAAVTPAELRDHRIWVPGIVAGSEWEAYYDVVAATFGLTIDPTGPNLSGEALLDAIAESSSVATLMGERMQLLWPIDHDLRRIPVRDPSLVYPHSLVWRRREPHPGVRTLRDHLEREGRTAAASTARARPWAP